MNSKGPRQSKQPKDTKLTQQELNACKPVLDSTWVVFIFAAVAVIMIPVGVICLVFGMQPVEIVQQYDLKCANGSTYDEMEENLWRKQPNSQVCTVSLNVTRQMRPPIFVYYELEGVYQNHRRYVKSRSDAQLAGNDVTSGLSQMCEPLAYKDGQTSNVSAIINPCGLIAWSNFNDSFTLKRAGGGDEQSPITVKDTGIALKSDREGRFGNYTPKNFNRDLWTPPGGVPRGGGNFTNLMNPAEEPSPVNSDERFIIWMRTAALPRFRKLWGRIDDVILEPGEVVEVTINNRWNSYKFRGQKSIVLGTTNWLGSNNPFLGIAFLVTGGVSLFMAVAYLACRCCFPRKFGDPSLLAEFRDH